MPWLPAAMTALIALAAFWVPGTAVLMALGRRGLEVVAIAPLVTLGVAGLGAIALEAVGIGWGAAPFLGLTLVAVPAAWLLARSVPTRWSTVPGHRWTGPAVAAAALAQLVAQAAGMGRPGRLLDAYDAIGHFNGIEYIRQTGHASSFTITGVHNAGIPTGFDGAAWPAVTSLMPRWPDAAVVFNAATYVPAAVAWAAGSAALTRAVLPRRPRLATWAALLSVAGIAHPLVLAQQQAGLVPNAVGAALLPAFLAVVVRWDRTRSRGDTLLLLLAAAGLGLTHPNVLILAGIIGTTFLVVRHRDALVRATRSMRGRLALWTVSGVVVAALPIVLTHPRMRGVLAYPGDSPYPWVDTVAAVFSGQMGISGGGGGVLVVLLAGVGAWSLRRHPVGSALTTAAVVMVAVFVLSRTGIPVLGDLDAPWFHEPKRLAPGVLALLPPLAAVGIDSAGAWLVATRRLTTSLRPRSASVLLGGIVVTTGMVLGGIETTAQAAFAFHPPAGSPTFATDDELALMSRLDDELDPTSTVLGSPHSGAAHLYGLIGQPVAVRTTSRALPPELRYVLRHIDELGHNESLCRALDDLGIAYLYVDPVRFRPEDGQLPQLVEPPPGGVRPLDSGGTATVYEITAC